MKNEGQMLATHYTWKATTGYSLFV